MFLESGPTPSLGLLHILEDTLSLLNGVELETKRREYVLKQSKAFLLQVKEGSGTNQSANPKRFPGPPRSRALHSYALASRYLGEPSARLDLTLLAVVEDALSKYEAAAPAQSKDKAIATLKSLCQGMGRDLSRAIVDAGEDERQLAL